MEITRHAYMYLEGEVMLRELSEKDFPKPYWCGRQVQKMLTRLSFFQSTTDRRRRLRMTIHLSQEYSRNSVLVELDKDYGRSWITGPRVRLNEGSISTQAYDNFYNDLIRFDGRWCYAGLWYGWV